MAAFIVLRRGDLVESRHRVHVAVTEDRGRLEWSAGDPGLVTFLRSAAKPFQAIPLVEDGVAEAFGLGPRELALCCGSHSGEPVHVEGVRRLLARSGVPETALGCGPHAPMSASAARELVRNDREPAAIHNNCSGKHAGMLALARHHGWPFEGYMDAGHPVQERVRTAVAERARVAPETIRTGIDGCGVVCFGLPLQAMARAFSALGRGAALGSPAERAVVDAMARYPERVAGTGRLCTSVIRATGGAVLAKVGAEGIYGALSRGGGSGVAIKVEDGARRAVEVALVRTLELLGLLPGEALAELSAHRAPAVRNTLGDAVAWLEGGFELERE